MATSASRSSRDRAGWDVGEHVAQLTDEAVLAFGRAQVGVLDVVMDAEARERDGGRDTFAGDLGAVALQQSRGVAVGICASTRLTKSSAVMVI